MFRYMRFVGCRQLAACGARRGSFSLDDGFSSLAERALVTDLGTCGSRGLVTHARTSRLCRCGCRCGRLFVAGVPFRRGVGSAFDTAWIVGSVSLRLAVKAAFSNLVFQSSGLSQQTERLFARYLSGRLSVRL